MHHFGGRVPVMAADAGRQDRRAGLDRWVWLVLLAILLLGLGLRFWSFDWGMPYILHPDEPHSINGAIRMLKTGDLNPHNFHWGTLIFYLNAILYWLYISIGRLSGLWTIPANLPYLDVTTIAVGKVPIPALFLLSRGMVALAGTACIIFAYLIGRDLKGRAAGLIAAFFLAILPTSVSLSHIVKSDTLLVLFSLVSVWATLLVLRQGKLSHYILAGLAAGLAVSSKYNAGVVLVPLVAAHFLRFGRRGIRRKELYIGLACAAVAFVATTPFAVLDFPTFWQDFRFDAVHYATGHAGAEGDSFRWYTEFLWNQFGVLLLLGIAGIFYSIIARSWAGVVVALFPLVYFAIVSQFTVHFDTTILPVTPFILLMAALPLTAVYNSIAKRWSAVRPAIGGAFVLLIGFLGLPLFTASANYDATVSEVNGHAEARLWIDEHLPPGSRVAVESYSPYVDPAKFTVEGVESMISHPPDWYEQNGYEYLVFSYGTYGRFFESPDRYPEFVAQYNAFFDRFQLIARFSGSGDEIRVYKTNAILPSRRVAAQWGIYSAWLELVGYEANSVRPGETLEAVLDWRSIEQRREPLKLTVRLVDHDSKEIASSNGDLFPSVDSSGRWPEGIVAAPIRLRVPDTAAVGTYRLEVDVDAQGQGRVPVLSRDRTPVSDKLYLGPIKLSPAPPSETELAEAQRVNVTFGQVLKLLGWSMPSEPIHPGGLLTPVLYWQKQGARKAKDYTVFLHLLDSSGRIRAQVDSQPYQGAYPTSLWDAGEVIRDVYSMPVPGDLPPGVYTLELGLYEYPSMQRLNAVGGSGQMEADRWALGTVHIER